MDLQPHDVISDHFMAKEFYCHDGTPITEEHLPQMKELLEFLERLRCVANWHNRIRGEIGIHIISGYRHPEYNKKCGGAKNSGHLFTEKGAAADIILSGPNTISYDEFWQMCIETDHSFPERKYRLGHYAKSKGINAWVHVGCDYGVGGTRWFK